MSISSYSVSNTKAQPRRPNNSDERLAFQKSDEWKTIRRQSVDQKHQADELEQLTRWRPPRIKTDAYHEECHRFMCEYYYGKKALKAGDEEPKPYPSINKPDLHEYLNKTYKSLPSGKRKTWLDKPSNGALDDHREGKITLYYVNNHKRTCSDARAMIDVDIQKSKGLGTTQGAVAFIEGFKRDYFPDLKYERSTNGKGIQGFFDFEKEGLSAEIVKQGFHRLQDLLRWYAKETNADIELVEVKGQPPLIKWDNGKCVEITYGQLAKLPRSSMDGTTKLSMREFLIDPTYDVPVSEQGEMASRPAAVKPCRTRSDSCGGSNFGGHALNFQEMSSHREHDLSLFSTLTGGKNYLPTNRDVRVRPEDWHIFCCFLRHAKKNPNSDGSCPMNWILGCKKRNQKGFWGILKEAGYTDRSPDHHRIKAMRDFASELGFINWIDHRYEAGEEINGEFVPGVACRWSITEEFSVLLNGSSNKEEGGRRGIASFMGGNLCQIPVPKGTGQHLLPELALIRTNYEELWLEDASKRLEKLFEFDPSESWTENASSQADEAHGLRPWADQCSNLIFSSS
jgi:hypothetical protein